MIAQYGDVCLSRTSVFDWCKSFEDRRESVRNEQPAARPTASINNKIIKRVEDLMMTKQTCIKLCVQSCRYIENDCTSFSKINFWNAKAYRSLFRFLLNLLQQRISKLYGFMSIHSKCDLKLWTFVLGAHPSKYQSKYCRITQRLGVWLTCARVVIDSGEPR